MLLGLKVQCRKLSTLTWAILVEISAQCARDRQPGVIWGFSRLSQLVNVDTLSFLHFRNFGRFLNVRT